MNFKFTARPSITKAVILTIVFFIIWAVSNVNLPACNTEQGILNSGGCVQSQSDLHVLSGWLAIASLITGLVLFILKTKKSRDESKPAV